MLNESGLVCFRQLKLYQINFFKYHPQQAVGLTDRQFEEDPRRSFRNRNWFNVDWNMAALTSTYKFSDQTQINTRNFALLAGRQSIGNLERINVADFGEERTLIVGDFRYFGKIGQILRTDSVLFNDYRYRTNIADARNMGIEAFGEVSLLNLLKKETENVKWTMFGNFSLIDARYIRTEDNSIRNRKVEMVPPVTVKLGSTFRFKSFSVSGQYSYVDAHFSDASNAVRTATAVEGLIPSYSVADLSTVYRWKSFSLEASINNLFNEQYFTRRADAYPGPGIIPADGRGFYTTLEMKF